MSVTGLVVDQQQPPYSEAAERVHVVVLSECPTVKAQIASLNISHNHNFFFAKTAREATYLLGRRAVDLYVLHWTIGDYEAIDACFNLRSHARSVSVCILILSEWRSDGALVRGYKAGADDYVALPVSTRELGIRISKLLARPPLSTFGPYLIHRGIVLDLVAHKVTVGDLNMVLSATAFRILKELMARHGQIISYREIGDVIGVGNSPMSLSAIRANISSLRRSLDTVKFTSLIRTVPKLGYVLD